MRAWIGTLLMTDCRLSGGRVTVCLRVELSLCVRSARPVLIDDDDDDGDDDGIVRSDGGTGRDLMDR